MGAGGLQIVLTRPSSHMLRLFFKASGREEEMLCGTRVLLVSPKLQILPSHDRPRPRPRHHGRHLQAPLLSVFRLVHLDPNCGSGI